MRTRRRAMRARTILGAGAVVVVVTASAAWACTAAIHQFWLSPKVQFGTAATAITVSGLCDSTGSPPHAGCADSGNRDIYMGVVATGPGNGWTGNPMENYAGVTQASQRTDPTGAPLYCSTNTSPTGSGALSIDIGDITSTSTSGTTLNYSGSGTVPAPGAISGGIVISPGYHAVCAGINPVLLWDNFLLA